MAGVRAGGCVGGRGGGLLVVVSWWWSCGGGLVVVVRGLGSSFQECLDHLDFDS